jgi:hypothetical protein
MMLLLEVEAEPMEWTLCAYCDCEAECFIVPRPFRLADGRTVYEVAAICLNCAEEDGTNP